MVTWSEIWELFIQNFENKLNDQMIQMFMKLKGADGVISNEKKFRSSLKDIPR